jgi:mRNA interferase HigB
MHVISRKRLREFDGRYPDAQGPLDEWFRLMRRGAFASPHRLKTIFPAVSFLGGRRVVFNIGGNKYRIITTILYARERSGGRVYIRAVMTHRQYDEWSAAQG